jgi:Rod binding domain-containing protein
MIPNVRGPLKPLAPASLDDRPGVPPVGPLLPMNERTDAVPHNTRGPRTEDDKIMATARKWVSQTFYGTLLKQMRSSPFKSELFEGGRGGQAFAPLLDQHLADHMAKGADNKLVKAIARKLLKGSNATKPVKNENAYQDVKIHVAPSLRA